MFLKTAIAKVTIDTKFTFLTGDDYLQSVDVILSEQERSSSGSFSIFDPDLKFLNLMLTEFQRVGGIMVPKNLLEEPKPISTDATTGSTTTTTGNVRIPDINSYPRNDDLARLIISEAPKYGITMREQIAYILGTVQRESDMGRVMKEEGGDRYLSYLEGRRDLGNTSPGDGIRYAGRGYYQITGKVNYIKWSKILNVDFVNKPELMELPKYAMPVMLIGMRDGLSTGKKLSDYIRPGKVDFINARRVVNSLDKAALIAGYARTWLSRLDSLGYKAPSTPGTGNTDTKPSGNTLQTNSSDTTNSSGVDSSKGIRVLIELGFNDSPDFTAYDFILTGIQGSNDIPHSTKIDSRQIRYVIAKGSKIHKTYQNISIRQIAENISSLVGAKIEIPDLDAVNAINAVVKQQDTDYKTLLKLAKENGLFVRGNSTTLKLEALKESDKQWKINKNALLKGSSWGDTASASRLLVGSETSSSPPESKPNNSVTETKTYDFAIPVKKGVLSQGFREGHNGIDLAGKAGELVLAAKGGGITVAGWDDFGLGNKIVIDHGTHVTTYGHNRKLLVKVGDKVSKGQAIAEMGNTGNSSGEHLHFEIYDVKKGTWVDPLTLIPDLKSGGITVYYQAKGNLKQLNDISGLTNAVLKTGTDNVTTTRAMLGIQDLSKKEDSKKGIGKGFEGNLNIDTTQQSEVLKIQPGEKVIIEENYGSGITRPFRISEVRHSYNKSGIKSSLDIYLPVSIEVKSSTTASATPSNSSGSSVTGTISFTGQFATPLKKGETIAGFPVTSPFGLRSSPGGIGSTNHQGTDVGCPSGTPYYPICKPGETINMQWVSFGGGGWTVIFTYGGWEFYYMHCIAGSGSSGIKKHGDVIARCDSTGNSTGNHLHFGQKPKGGKFINPHRGFIHWCLTGKSPT